MIATRVITHRHCHRLSEVFFRARVHTKNPIYQRQILFLDLPRHAARPSLPPQRPPAGKRAPSSPTPPYRRSRPMLRHPGPPRQPLLALRTPLRLQKSDRRHRSRDINWVAATDMERERKVTRVHRKRDKLGVLFQSGDEQCTLTHTHTHIAWAYIILTQ